VDTERKTEERKEKEKEKGKGKGKGKGKWKKKRKGKRKRKGTEGEGKGKGNGKGKKGKKERVREREKEERCVDANVVSTVECRRVHKRLQRLTTLALHPLRCTHAVQYSSCSGKKNENSCGYCLLLMCGAC